LTKLVHADPAPLGRLDEVVSIHAATVASACVSAVPKSLVAILGCRRRVRRRDPALSRSTCGVRRSVAREL
jgi:hypothetical protein